MAAFQGPNCAFEYGRADKQRAFGERRWRRAAPLNANVEAPMKAICLMMSIGALLMNGYGQAAETDSCPVQGEAIQWIADYCMFKLETDDEIAVSGCIADEIKTSLKSDCVAKAHYKRALCELTIRAEATQGPVERCVADGSFMGSTVRNGGVGAQQQVPANGSRSTGLVGR